MVELRPLDPPAVDEAAVGALQIADHVGFTDLADLGVPPRDLVVFQLDDVARLAADADGPLAGGEVEPCAAVAALDDKQRRHGEGALEGGPLDAAVRGEPPDSGTPPRRREAAAVAVGMERSRGENVDTIPPRCRGGMRRPRSTGNVPVSGVENR